jgi:hypothetical protein
MDVDTDALNRQYFDFLKYVYGFSYSGGTYGDGTYSSQDIEVSLRVTGYTAGVLSWVEVYIWFKQEPKYTESNIQWIADYWGIAVDLKDLGSSLRRNYQKLSSFFHEHATEILYSHEEWLLPTMKLHFEKALDFSYGGNLQALLTTPSSADLYHYLKNQDPNWKP